MHRSYEPRFLQIAHSLGFLFRLCEAGVNFLIAVKSEKLTVEGQTLRHFLGSFKPQPQQGKSASVPCLPCPFQVHASGLTVATLGSCPQICPASPWGRYLTAGSHPSRFCVSLFLCMFRYGCQNLSSRPAPSPPAPPPLLPVSSITEETWLSHTWPLIHSCLFSDGILWVRVAGSADHF